MMILYSQNPKYNVKTIVELYLHNENDVNSGFFIQLKHKGIGWFCIRRSNTSTKNCCKYCKIPLLSPPGFKPPPRIKAHPFSNEYIIPDM